ncbi:MAG: filamentous hemagglutinin N-terminal domain-containing protein [Candidatus Pacebacteria bacterium]|nr:filamentous hemagglutinin N-terminal domain-containing protein [Candidatus Paceibacterota bacterium]
MNIMQNVNRRMIGLLLATVSPVIAIMASQGAMALPTGGTVIQGAVSIDHGLLVANQVTINQTDDRAVIEWSNFNLESNETAQFIVPSASSATLNRITDQVASSIKGTVTSNGIVYFVNPNGIVFHAGSSFTTNGIFVTTAAIDTTPFMNNQFGGSSFGSGSIVLNGTIAAPRVTVSADTITVNGTITAANGSIELTSKTSSRIGAGAVIRAAGLTSTVTLNSDGDIALLGTENNRIHIAAGQLIWINGKTNSGLDYAVFEGSLRLGDGTNLGSLPVVIDPRTDPTSYFKAQNGNLNINLGGVVKSGEFAINLIEVKSKSAEIENNKTYESIPHKVIVPIQSSPKIEANQSGSFASFVTTPLVTIADSSAQLGNFTTSAELNRPSPMAPQPGNDYSNPQLSKISASSSRGVEINPLPPVSKGKKTVFANPLRIGEADDVTAGMVLSLN